MRRSAPRPPSAALSQAIESDGLPSWIGSASLLRVAESKGNYSGRKVTYIRVFDPALAVERAFTVGGYKDLDARPELILRSGHVESDGVVILNRHPVDVDPRQPVRTRAGRIVPSSDAVVAQPDTLEASGAPS